MERPAIVVGYGSETGTACMVAERVGREARRRGFECRVVALDSLDMGSLPLLRVLICIVATTGDGDTPATMRSVFWPFLLRRSLPAQSLGNTEVAVFGLGDSTYPKYNFVAKRLHNRLLALGGRMLLPLGLGNDAHVLGYDFALDPFLRDLWTVLLRKYPAPAHFQTIADHHILSRYVVKCLPAPTVAHGSCFHAHPREDRLTQLPSSTSPFFAKLKVNKRITALDHFQDVRHMELDITGSMISYKSGDVLAIQPRNEVRDVEYVAEVFGLALDTVLDITPVQADVSPIPTLNGPITFRELLEAHLDLHAIPSRYFFQVLAYVAQNEAEKERLLEFSSADHLDDLYSYANRMRRTSAESLRDFPSTHGHIPLAFLFELFQPLYSRSFSISSSERVDPTRIHLTVAIVDYKTRMQEARHGVCTRWFTRLSENDLLPVWHKAGTFKIPDDPSIPLILIGPGTGCAPFRGVIQQRALRDEPRAALLFIFGNRNERADFLYGDEWTELVRENRLELITAFSRDQEEKIYVQHRIVEHGARVWQLMHQGARIFLAGSSKQMPASVREALETVACTWGKISAVEAKTLIGKILQSETW